MTYIKPESEEPYPILEIAVEDGKLVFRVLSKTEVIETFVVKSRSDLEFIHTCVLSVRK
jgi:hypothetical protein